MTGYAMALDAPPWTARDGYRALARAAGIRPYLPSPIAMLRCETCDGEGVVAEKVCHHSGLCPCDWEDAECPTCRGTGEQPCAACGEGIAVGVDSWGDMCCAVCLREEPIRTATEPAPGKVPEGPASFGVRDCRMDTGPAETTRPDRSGQSAGSGSRGRRATRREGTRQVQRLFNPASGGGAR